MTRLTIQEERVEKKGETAIVCMVAPSSRSRLRLMFAQWLNVKDLVSIDHEPPTFFDQLLSLLSFLNRLSLSLRFLRFIYIACTQAVSEIAYSI